MRDRLAIVSAERIRDELSQAAAGRRPVGRAVVPRATTGLADEFLPELHAMRLEQDPIHRHKDVLAHTIAVVRQDAPATACCASPRCSTTSASRRPAPSRTGGVTLPPPRGGRRPHDRERLHALRYPNDVVDDVTQLVYLHLRFHTYAMGWTDRAVRRYVRDAGPLLDRSTSCSGRDCTTRNQRKARALERRMDELEARIAELRERGGARARSGPPLDGRQVMDVPRRPARAASWARPSTSCWSSASTRARSARREAYRRLAARLEGLAYRRGSDAWDSTPARRRPRPAGGPRRRGTAPAATS